MCVEPSLAQKREEHLKYVEGGGEGRAGRFYRRLFKTAKTFFLNVGLQLGQLEVFLKSHLQDFLKTGGRGAIISFHSLEDRLVKNAFRDKHRFRLLTPKPVIPAAVEQRANPRSRSAKLRAVERL